MKNHFNKTQYACKRTAADLLMQITLSSSPSSTTTALLLASSKQQQVHTSVCFFWKHQCQYHFEFSFEFSIQRQLTLNWIELNILALSLVVVVVVVVILIDDDASSVHPCIEYYKYRQLTAVFVNDHAVVLTFLWSWSSTQNDVEDSKKLNRTLRWKILNEIRDCNNNKCNQEQKTLNRHIKSVSLS